MTLATDAFDYPLPPERIAQTPLARRDASLLLQVGAHGELEDHVFSELPELLRPGDLLVANSTRVRSARLNGRRDDGGDAEILVLAPDGTPDRFHCLVRPGRRLPEGSRVRVGDDLVAVVGGSAPGHPGARVVEFSGAGDTVAAIERHGEAPLPPYIHEHLDDPERYQTTYATGPPRSAAAPTAGLHFTDSVRERLRERGVEWTEVDLVVGLATFSPIRSAHVEEHPMHEETFSLPPSAEAAVRACRARGGRVIAVGTTSVRVLESRAADDGTVTAGEGSTRLYLHPGVRLRVVDGLVTNFHQPRSSLLVLLAAFLGMERWRRAYEHALAGPYRFLSFGDCMLAWRPE